MEAAAHPGAAPGQVALRLAGLFCLKPTLSPEPVFPLPGGDRKTQGPRLDVSPNPWHQQEVGGAVCGKITRPDPQPQTPTSIWLLLGKAGQGLLCPINIQYTEGGHGRPRVHFLAQRASPGSQPNAGL